MKTLTVEQAAYIAGFLDGEGYFACRYREGAVVGRYYAHYVITVCQKRPAVLYWMIEVTGVGRVGKRKRSDGSPLSPMLSITGKDKVVGLLSQILPYMIVRHDDVEKVINGIDITPEKPTP
jgi:hypothetical protein